MGLIGMGRGSEGFGHLLAGLLQGLVAYGPGFDQVQGVHRSLRLMPRPPLHGLGLTAAPLGTQRPCIIDHSVSVATFFAARI